MLCMSGNDRILLHLCVTLHDVLYCLTYLYCYMQEEYNDGEDLGMLECGHDFHSDCIKQWLKHKNLCPICKTTALAT